MTPKSCLNLVEAISLLLSVAIVSLLWLQLAASFDPMATSYLPDALLEVLQ